MGVIIEDKDLPKKRYDSMVTLIRELGVAEISPDDLAGATPSEKCLTIRQACKNRRVKVATKVLRVNYVKAIRVTVLPKGDLNVSQKNQEEN
jgi:hypothetical protein